MPTIIVNWSKSRSPDQQQSMTKTTSQPLVENRSTSQQDGVVFYRDKHGDDTVYGYTQSLSVNDNLSNDISEGG